MHTDMRVIEQNFGKYEGGGRRSKEFSEARNNFIYSFDGGESMLKAASRVYNILNEIKKDKDKTYLYCGTQWYSKNCKLIFQRYGK